MRSLANKTCFLYKTFIWRGCIEGGWVVAPLKFWCGGQRGFGCAALSHPTRYKQGYAGTAPNY